jgi:hypothetical protein
VTAPTPERPERDPQAEQDCAEWRGWMEANAYSTHPDDCEGMAEAFEAGMWAARDLGAAQEPKPVPASPCTYWSDPSDDFYGVCVKDAYHDREGDPEHENEHGIRWTGSRWESVAARHASDAGLPAGAAAILAQAAPELAAAFDGLDFERNQVIELRAVVLDMARSIRASMNGGGRIARSEVIDWTERAGVEFDIYAEPGSDQ